MADLIMSFGSRTRTISAPKVIVDEYFEKAFKKICQDWMEKHKNNVSFVKRNKVASNRVYDILSGRETERSGFKYEITRLRNTKGFTKFSVGKRKDDVFLVGRTVPIEWIKCSTQDRPGDETFYMGPFDIYIPISGLVNGTVTNTHLVPVRLPLVRGRTAHHYVHRPEIENPDYDEDDEEENNEWLSSPSYKDYLNAGFHPVDFPEHTCYGDLSTIIQGSTRALDIASLFSSWYQHVSVYNYGSPLYAISRIYDEWLDEDIDLREPYHGTEG